MGYFSRITRGCLYGTIAGVTGIAFGIGLLPVIALATICSVKGSLKD
jgi:hypothetical protein